MKRGIISDIEISKEDKRLIEIARKYHLRVGTWKCQLYYLFEQGYKPREVKYILRDYIATIDDPMLRTIDRYYYDWKKAQAIG